MKNPLISPPFLREEALPEAHPPCHIPLIAQSFAAVAALAFLGGPAAADPDGNGGASGVTNPAILALVTNDTVFATADLSVLLSPPGGPSSQHYGPYPSDSPDSGTCGNDWATDRFDRHFLVKSNHDGTFTVVQQFKRGSFVTNLGPSPGACEPDGSLGGVIRAGVTGTMHGHCKATAMDNVNCTTTTFINTHFAPFYPVTCTVTTFAFDFTAPDQGLFEHHWKNASL
jgi:hypothetical protein